MADEKQGLGDFLLNLGGLFKEVEGGGLVDFLNDRRGHGEGPWWELFDLDVEPKTQGALDVAWKTWRIENHPDKGVVSAKRYQYMTALYDRKRKGLPEQAATG